MTAFKKKVLITGGYGFLGQAIAERFIKEGWDVFILDDLSSAQMKKVSAAHHFYPYSVTDGRCEELFRIHNLDVVIHNAERSTSFKREGYMENSEINFLGLVNMLHLSSKYGVKKFFLTSTGSLVDHARIAANEDELPLITNPRTMQKDINEKYALHWQRVFGLNVTALRFASVYGPGQLPDHGVISQFMHAALYGIPFRFKGSAQQTRDMLYVDDAAFAVYQAAERSYNGDRMNISSNQQMTFQSLLDTCQQFMKLPDIIWDSETVGNFQRATLDNSLCRKELGWYQKADLATGLRQTYDWYKEWKQQDEKLQQKKKQQAIRQKKIDTFKPYLENLVAFCLMVGIMFSQKGSMVNTSIGLDFNYIYIAAMGILYGKKQSIPAVVLSTALLGYSFTQNGADLVALLYLPQHLLHFAAYLFLGVLTGYITDKHDLHLESEQYQKNKLHERYAFLEKRYEESIAVKERLYQQIVNSNDSIGRVYRIIRGLDSVELENVFTKAAEVTAEILSVERVALYVVGKNGLYLRQKVRCGSGMEQVPRSLRIADTPYLEEVLYAKRIFFNRKLQKNLPDLAAPIVYDNKVIAVIEIFGLDFSQWSLAQQNLLSLTARLIASAMGKAYRYEESRQSSKYLPNTRILQEAEFYKIRLEIVERCQMQQVPVPIEFLRLELAGRSYEEMDQLLAATARAEDFLGLYEGELYLLLIDIAKDTVENVRQRLRQKGIQSQAVGDRL